MATSLTWPHYASDVLKHIRCGKSARPDPWRGCSVMGIPTPTCSEWKGLKCWPGRKPCRSPLSASRRQPQSWRLRSGTGGETGTRAPMMQRPVREAWRACWWTSLFFYQPAMVGNVNPQRPHVLSVRGALWTIGSFSLRGLGRDFWRLQETRRSRQKLNARNTRRSPIFLRRIIGSMSMRVNSKCAHQVRPPRTR